jgi:hypothetical protein
MMQPLPLLVLGYNWYYILWQKCPQSVKFTTYALENVENFVIPFIGHRFRKSQFLLAA